MKIERISYTFTEVTAETTYTSLPTLLYNKTLFEYGKTRYIRMRGNGTAYFYKRDKERAVTATVTDHVTVTNPTADRDYDDNTRIDISVPASTSNYLIRTYDFGSNKTRFVFIKHQAYSLYQTSKILASQDGSNWTVLSTANNVAVSTVVKSTFRYLRWMGDNTETSARSIYLYTLEAFDLDDYTDSNNTLLVIKGYGDIGWVFLDGTRLNVYAYDLSEVKVTHTYYEVVM